MPFGEYIPARSFFARLADVSAVPRDAIAGRGPGVVDTPAGRLGVLISYEVFFQDRGRAAVRAGGRLLLVPTNASSFDDAQVPAHELAVARLRALETGRWVVQAAPTGYSAVVDHRGRVLARSRPGRAGRPPPRRRAPHRSHRLRRPRIRRPSSSSPRSSLLGRAFDGIENLSVGMTSLLMELLRRQR